MPIPIPSLKKTTRACASTDVSTIHSKHVHHLRSEVLKFTVRMQIIEENGLNFAVQEPN
ncbi:hypothetical protein BVRB_1g012270 [Beta vulgaris subsp. vulgaris]|nr:hypothetical protein BVRB_1g012270 [Beta vulgaris subsp. vulgaris]